MEALDILVEFESADARLEFMGRHYGWACYLVRTKKNNEIGFFGIRPVEARYLHAALKEVKHTIRHDYEVESMDD